MRCVTTVLTREKSDDILCPAKIRTTVLEGLNHIASFPPLSDTVTRAMVMINEPEVSLPEVTSLIRRDAVMAAAVYRMANSSLYRGKEVVKDLKQAVLRIGLKECTKIICKAGVQGMYANCSPIVRDRCDTLLKHSLFVANLASRVNSVGNLGLSGVVFTCGLMHDIGRIIASVRAPEEAGLADPISFDENDDTLSRERAYLGIDHSAIGYQFATQNELPEEAARVILNHHRPDDERLEPKLVALIALADAIANHAQREHALRGFESAKQPTYLSLVNGWEPVREQQFRKSLPENVVESLRETRRMLRAV